MLIGGDFNLTRGISDKNNENINFHWSDLFNNWINLLGLIELKNTTRNYTWTNNQDNPVMAILDRVFISTDLDSCTQTLVLLVLPVLPEQVVTMFP